MQYGGVMFTNIRDFGRSDISGNKVFALFSFTRLVQKLENANSMWWQNQRSIEDTMPLRNH